MPTFPAPGSRAHRASAFTLVELVLIMALLGAVLFLVLPSFQSLLQGTVEKEVNRLTGVIRLLRNEAVLTRRPYRLVIDLKQHEYVVEERTLDGKYVAVTRPPLLAKHAFPPAFQVKDLILNGNTRYPLVERRVEIALDASGFMDPFALRFAVDGVKYTLAVSGFTAEVSLKEGHDVE